MSFEENRWNPFFGSITFARRMKLHFSISEKKNETGYKAMW